MGIAYIPYNILFKEQEAKDIARDEDRWSLLLKKTDDIKEIIRAARFLERHFAGSWIRADSMVSYIEHVSPPTDKNKRGMIWLDINGGLHIGPIGMYFDLYVPAKYPAR